MVKTILKTNFKFQMIFFYAYLVIVALYAHMLNLKLCIDYSVFFAYEGKKPDVKQSLLSKPMWRISHYVLQIFVSVFTCLVNKWQAIL